MILEENHTKKLDIGQMIRYLEEERFSVEIMTLEGKLWFCKIMAKKKGVMISIDFYI